MDVATARSGSEKAKDSTTIKRQRLYDYKTTEYTKNEFHFDFFSDPPPPSLLNIMLYIANKDSVLSFAVCVCIKKEVDIVQFKIQNNFERGKAEDSKNCSKHGWIVNTGQFLNCET